MARSQRLSALCAALLTLRGASAAAPRVWGKGANFLQAGAAHPASGDIVLVGDPYDKGSTKKSRPVSVAVVPGGSAPGAGFESLAVVDDGSAAAYPVDVAVAGDTALVLDQAGGGGLAAFNRTSAGAWELWRRWGFGDLLEACDSEGRQYGQPEAIALSPQGEIYVSMAVSYNKRCLLHPLDRCCSKVSASTAVMRLDLHGQASLHEVFNTKSFFTYGDGKDGGFHVRAMDVTESGDIVIAGYGDDVGYYAHSVWRWQWQSRQARRIAGLDCCQGNHSADGSEARRAALDLPWGLAAVGDAVYVSEAGNTDVRAVAGGVISTVKGAPRGADRYENHYFRKLHRGAKAGTLLLAVSGLGADEGRLVEFDLAGEAAPTFVV